MYSIGSIERSGDVIVRNVRRADSFTSRLIGLLLRRSLALEDGLLLPKTRQVHCFGMRFSIDLVFLHENGSVISVQSNLRPWGVSRYEPEASAVLELAATALKTYGIEPGQVLQFRHANP